MLINTNYTDTDYIRYHYKNLIFDVPANIILLFSEKCTKFQKNIFL